MLPPIRAAEALTVSRATNTNQCPLAGFSARRLRTNPDSPSKERLMSVGFVPKQMRCCAAGVSTMAPGAISTALLQT